MLPTLMLLALLGVSGYSSAALQMGSRPALVRSAPRPTAPVQMQVPVEEEEEFMDEAEYEAELAKEAAAAGAPAASQEMSADAKKVINNMKSSTGVEFAPWMKVDAEAIAKAKKEREERKARLAAQNVRGDSMLLDPQAAELGAGGGLQSKTLSEEEIELRWSTADEAGNAGFIVQRRKGGQPDFEDIESYERFAPLRTKGPDGGDYVYLDDSVAPGTWVYRILDCDTKGRRSAVCQKLVEVDSAAESTQTLVVGGFILLLAIAGVAAGTFLDPMQTTDKGASFF